MEEDAFGSLASSSTSGHSMAFPVLEHSDLNRVAETITHLFDPSTSSNPSLAKSLQNDLQVVQQSNEAWGLISGLANHEDPNIRFFSAHTAQVKISRDWNTLPHELQPALLQLLLHTLAQSISPSNPVSHQPANNVVVRKLFGCLASILLRLPFHLFPNPLITVLSTISDAATNASLPPSMPSSGYNTPTMNFDAGATGRRMRVWSLEWLAICVEEIGRAGISEQKKNALRRHLDVDLPQVLDTIKHSMAHPELAESACKCAESWIDYGLGADELTELLPHLYALLPLPAASSALVEVLSESVFRFGKGAKILTEPLVQWCTGPQGSQLLNGDITSDEVVGFAKLLCAIVEHSSEWLVARIQEPSVQAFLGIVLRLTGCEGLSGVEENISELTLPIYPLLQEAVMDSDTFSAPHETSPEWQVAKQFFKELVSITRRKVRWPDDKLDKEDKEAFETYRRDAGEVIVGAYYILREEMLRFLTDDLMNLINTGAAWQDVEAVLHCIRYSSEAVPLGESQFMPIVFGDALTGLTQRHEDRLRLTTVCVIQSYEEWFRTHPDHLLPVLSYLVESLSTASSHISRYAADALKALCDICRNKLVQHIGAFAQLHDKIGDLGSEEQVKVIQAITSVIQALPPNEAIGPVEGILHPVVDRLNQATAAVQSDPSAQALLVQALSSLTAAYKGLTPSDDDMFELDAPEVDIGPAQADSRMVALRLKIETAIQSVVVVWNGDSEVADSLSALVKNSTSDTLIALSPLPLLTLVTSAAERSSSALWMSLASTLVLRINSPPSPLTRRKDRTQDESAQHERDELERWNVVADAAGRLVVVAGNTFTGSGAMSEHPDVVEGWFKFCSALSSRFPGVLLRLPSHSVEGYMTLGVLGLGAQERFSLKSTSDFFVALLSNTKYPSPLEPLSEDLFKHFGAQILRSLLLSAGSEGPRSVIPNLAELLACLVQRIPGEAMASWLNAILVEEGFPSAKSTPASKDRLKEVVLKSRTTKRMREALHEFALVARGLDNTTYGNATM